MAARGARAAAGDAGGRVYPRRVGRCLRALCGRVPQRPQRNRLRRRPERDGRVPLAGGPIRSPAGADGRSGPPTGGRDRHARQRALRSRPKLQQRRSRSSSASAKTRSRLGLVASLARPGGNATGINFFAQEVVAKRLRLLHDLVPKAVRVAVLVNPANASVAETTLREVQEAAPTIGLQIQILNATTIGEIDAAFATLARERPDALFVAADAFFDQPPRAICHLDGARQDSGGLSGSVNLWQPAG